MIRISQEVWGVTIALMGGVTTFLLSDEHSIMKFVVTLVAAGFAGWLTYLLCSGFDIAPNLTSAICGMSGLSGKASIKLFQAVFIKKVKDYTGLPK